MDDLPIPDLDWSIIAWAGAGVLAVILIFYFRSRSESAAGTILAEEASFDDPSIEYEWVAEPRIWGRVLLALFIVAAGVVAFFSIEELQEVFRSILQIGIVLLGLLSSIFANAFKRYLYRITTTGLYRSEVGKKGDPKLLFTWRRLLWFSPGQAGFRYYLKPNGEGSLNLLNTGHVLTGDRAMLVNAIIMSRGVPTSPPNRDEHYEEPDRSYERS